MNLRKLETLISDGYYMPDMDINFDPRITKPANMVEDDCPERFPCCYRENNKSLIEILVL